MARSIQQTKQQAEQPESLTRPPRAILYGASNLTLLLPSLLRWGPSGVWVAHCGHGRALTTPSRVLLRALPSSFDARWCASLDRSRLEALLVMDLGLDLLYGASLPKVLAQLECLFDAFPQVVPTVVAPPVATVEGLGPIRFHILRRLFFPFRQVNRPRVVAELRALESKLSAWADDGRLRLVHIDRQRYGLDAIHLRRAERRTVARQILTAMFPAMAEADPRSARATRHQVPLHFRLVAWPEHLQLAGRSLSRQQPCARLRAARSRSSESDTGGASAIEPSGSSASSVGIELWLR